MQTERWREKGLPLVDGVADWLSQVIAVSAAVLHHLSV